MNRELFFEIEGSCPVKKNQYKYTVRNGKLWGYKPKNIISYIESALWQLKSQKKKYEVTPLPICSKVSVFLLFEIAGRDKDIDGMTTTIYDVLQQAEIIKNDSQITQAEQIKKKGKEDLVKIYVKEL